MIEDAYIIFSKIPEAGYVKTRLQPDLSAVEAANIQKLMLDKLIRVSKQVKISTDIFFAYKGHDDAITADFLNNLPDWIHCFPQVEGSIGLKMSKAIEAVQEQGYKRVILTGGDIPQLTPQAIENAKAALLDHDVVLGPSYDGGYYMFGAGQLSVEEFLDADISWSTASVLDTTIKLLQDADKTVKLLPKLLDVDFKADLDKNIEFIKEN
ncbi:TIGR04282 family arsenosugar biosynthesis glycosyltransferase [Companilactobacillus baiquanensis]|uniref:TIGR04282 family arsenosugar biosynthesis glycosyltransferase n=1 Tax=Companilactobacillus baiquanensis TaxID=2486005 RepID=A0ABW1UW24_9LACO|nr:TIGR04282 family arsenosugar biosynthesis glycosyltransferase [Companilactobacillus baiquanensis]